MWGAMTEIQRHFRTETELAGLDALPAEGAFQACVAAVARLMHADVASLYEFAADRGELTLIATVGLPHSAVGFVTLALGEGVTGRAAAEQAPYAVSDVAADPHFKLIPGFDQSGYRSILAVPVLAEGVLLGALNVQTVAEHAYDAAEVSALVELSELIAPLFTRWRNDGDSARQLRGPKLLSMVDGMAAAALAPRELCQRLVDDLAAVLPLVDCGVRLHGDASGWIGAEIGDDPAGVTVTLRGDTRECGILALRNRGAEVPPWDNPAAWHYVGSIAEQFGIALERALDVSARHGYPGDSDTYDSLVSVVLDDRGLDGLVEEVARRSEATVTVLDSFGIVLAGDRAQDPRGDNPPVNAGPYRDVPIRAGDQQLGILRVAGGQASDAMLETAAQVVALELIKWRVGFEVETRLRGDLLELLLSGADANPREVIPRASLSGLDLRRPYTPVMLAIDPSSPMGRNPMAMRSMVELVQRRFGAPPRAVVFQRNDGLLALIADDGPSEVTAAAEMARNDLARLSPRARIGLGIGRSTLWPDGFRRSVQTTVRAAEYGLRTGLDRGIRSDELGSYGLLVALEPEVLAEYVHAQLGVLIEQDERSGGDLVATLEAYHLAGDRLKPAAEALFIHVNTMKYRIARIDALTEGALSSPVRRHDLYLALHALRVVDSDRKTMLGDNAAPS